MRMLIALFAILFCPAFADANSLELDRFIGEAEQNLSKNSLLEATFKQTVTMPFIDVPLHSSGKFCFNISDRKKPAIFWEYQKPDISGFLYKDGKADFWTEDKTHALSESEMGYLKSMTDQILQWISFDPARLKQIYTIKAGSAPRSLLFEPKEKSRLFDAIGLTLSPDLRRLDELSFYGKKGEVTTIKFDVQTENKPLSQECRR